MTNKEKILLCLIVFGLIIVFFLGRNLGSKEKNVQLLDVNKYEKSIDSLKIISGLHQDTVKLLKSERDYLKSVKVINNKKVNNAIKEVNNFNSVSRKRFEDSVAKTIR